MNSTFILRSWFARQRSCVLLPLRRECLTPGKRRFSIPCKKFGLLCRKSRTVAESLRKIAIDRASCILTLRRSRSSISTSPSRRGCGHPIRFIRQCGPWPSFTRLFIAACVKASYRPLTPRIFPPVLRACRGGVVEAHTGTGRSAVANQRPETNDRHMLGPPPISDCIFRS